MQVAEKQKNLQALGLTAISCICIALLLFFVGWTLPKTPPPPVDEGIEVNLGNSDQGLGDIPPMLPGEPSVNEQQEAIATPPTTTSTTEPEETKEIEHNEATDVPVVKVTPKPRTKEKPKPKVIEEKSVAKTKPKATMNPTPTKPSPKAVYKGGPKKDNGGNGADSYNNVRNQGIAGGKGDQGKVNGNPNSDSYTGNGGTGRSGVSIRNGLQGRRFASFPSFEDNFNENAKVAVDIVVNEAGHVTSASVNPRGTTTTNGNIRSIALRKAKQLKFNTSKTDTQTGTIVFNFKLKG